MAENKTKLTEASVESYVAAIVDETRREDCAALAKIDVPGDEGEAQDVGDQHRRLRHLPLQIRAAAMRATPAWSDSPRARATSASTSWRPSPGATRSSPNSAVTSAARVALTSASSPMSTSTFSSSSSPAPSPSVGAGKAAPERGASGIGSRADEPGFAVHRKRQPWSSARSRSAWRSRTSQASRKFYEKLGFTSFGGDAAQNWLILKNGDHHHRPLPGDVREEHPHVQPRLGQQRPEALASSPTCASCSASLKALGVHVRRPRPTRARQAPPASSRWTPTGTRSSSTSTSDVARGGFLAPP